MDEMKSEERGKRDSNGVRDIRVGTRADRLSSEHILSCVHPYMNHGP